MVKAFLFDVDGTITPSRDEIDRTFYHKLVMLAQQYPVILVTGSDRPKTIEQVGDLVLHAHTVYHCNGNDVWKGNHNIWRSPWYISQEAREWLERQLKLSKYHTRTGKHIEERPGMVNFSVVGRGANPTQRAEYYLWDKVAGERETVAKAFNKFFPDLSAQVAGETGIDIIQKGKDKSQIITDMPEGWELHFFGDRMDKDGNDYSLSVAINERGGYNHPVKNWKETWDKLISLRL